MRKPVWLGSPFGEIGPVTYGYKAGQHANKRSIYYAAFWLGLSSFLNVELLTFACPIFFATSA